MNLTCPNCGITWHPEADFGELVCNCFSVATQGGPNPDDVNWERPLVRPEGGGHFLGDMAVAPTADEIDELP